MELRAILLAWSGWIVMYFAFFLGNLNGTDIDYFFSYSYRHLKYNLLLLYWTEPEQNANIV